MKKTFSFKTENKTPERQADKIKNEIKKYISRERKKELPERVDYWDFDCKFGTSADDASVIHLSEINKLITTYVEQERDSFYLEILAKPGHRGPKKR